MADIELVIKIPEKTYGHLLNGGNIGASLMIENALKDGTPLPKGHGKLIDADALKKNYKTGYWNLHKVLDNAKPIIEADKEDE